jgi:diaminohydroxyphosphoribosylaminopyrimidine deaminase/5-amino-6-(5-phosphoribosylamino)uracil reductase
VPADSKVFDSAAETVQVKSRDLSELVSKLNGLDINQVFVEAGTTLASAMVAGGLMDELVIYQAPALLGSGKPFFADDSVSTIEDQMRLEHISTEVLAGDVKSVYRIGVGV